MSHASQRLALPKSEIPLHSICQQGRQKVVKSEEGGARSKGPKLAAQGGEWDFSPLPPAKGSGEQCTLAQWGPGQSPGVWGKAPADIDFCIFNPTESIYLGS